MWSILTSRWGGRRGKWGGIYIFNPAFPTAVDLIILVRFDVILSILMSTRSALDLNKNWFLNIMINSTLRASRNYYHLSMWGLTGRWCNVLPLSSFLPGRSPLYRFLWVQRRRNTRPPGVHRAELLIGTYMFLGPGWFFSVIVLLLYFYFYWTYTLPL